MNKTNTSGDPRFMNRALKLAKRGDGWVNPNPQVGAVLVKHGEVIGQGYHRRLGEDHAEVNALKQAGRQAKNADLYVNLEPCTHHGKTPPCTDALIQTGIKRAFIAIPDPNPKVNGRGINKLRAEGIEVEVGLKSNQARRLNEIYFRYTQTEQPFVLLKLAMSADGKIATRTGDSQWITSKPARRMVHKFRARYSAVAVGVGTMMADDPRLTVRHADGPDGARFVLDSSCQSPPSATMFKLDSNAPSIVVTTNGTDPRQEEELLNCGASVWHLPTSEKGHIRLSAFLNRLGDEEYDSLLVEGGSQLAWNFIESNLVDKVALFIAPRIIGGKGAVPAIGGEGFETVSESLTLKNTSIQRVGKDFLYTGYPIKNQ